MIAGLESITSGALRIGDRVVNDVPPKERDIAMVFQSYALYPHMTVRENMAFALKLRGRPAAEIARACDEAAATLGLERIARPASRASSPAASGSASRSAARSCASRGVPVRRAALQPRRRAAQRDARASSRALHRHLGATMIYVTHDQVEAMTLGDRIVVMHEGRIAQVDTPPTACIDTRATPTSPGSSAVRR